MNLHHIAIVCQSEENADRFYGNLLGLEKKKTSSLDRELCLKLFRIDGETRMIYYEGPTFSIEVFIPAVRMNRSLTFTHSCFSVESRADFVAKCREAGATVIEAYKGESLVVLITDFDGNQFEIKELS